MNLHLNSWIATIIFIIASIVQIEANAQQPFGINIDCQKGSSLQETIDGYIKPLKLFPEPVLNEKLAATLRTIKDTSSAVKELRKACTAAFNDKDGIYTFFYTLDLLSKGTPYAPILSQDIKFGKELIARAENIALNVGQELLKDNNGVVTEFWIKLSKNNCSTVWWSSCKWATGQEIIDKVKSVTILYRKQGSKDVLETSKPMGGEAGGQYYKIDTGDALTSDDTSVATVMYLKISWSNGQNSIIPLVKGVVSLVLHHFELQFNNTNNWFEYKY